MAYVCPADQKAVAHAGKCPRCDMNARVERNAAHVAPREMDAAEAPWMGAVGDSK